MADIEVGPEGRAPQKGSPFSRVLRMLGGFVALPLGLGIGAIMPSCMGFGEPAIAMTNACPAAVSVLGSPIHQGYLGLSCGNAETEDDDGNATWSFPVAGPNGRGSLDLIGVEHGGSWQFQRLVLTAGDRTIDVVACAAGGSGEMVNITHRELTGTVVGEPGVTSGATCIVTLDPAEGAQNCRLGIVCGDRTLYGGGTQGYGHCATDAQGAVMLRDGNPTGVDGDPMIDLRAGEIVVTDQGASGTWVVTMTTP